uniref:RNA-directed DNA polymerase, eukaryota n=1 Tax=Tanacetum cinerariifolium TaxID=118510 RepID=A0A6L2KAX0_TANCI|nr:RNA-directed DNA polymerase, eukaryota [Tanacetum cinerariifolium]
MVGECMSRHQAWDDTVLKLRSRLSNWKMVRFGFALFKRCTDLLLFLIRRPVLAGSEHQQMVDLNSLLESVSLSQSHDRWFCDLTGVGEFQVNEMRVSPDHYSPDMSMVGVGLAGLMSFSDWQSWFSSIRLPSKVKNMLEGVFCVAWWSIW